METPKHVHVELAKKAGKASRQWRTCNRPDLFDDYKLAHTQIKALIRRYDIVTNCHDKADLIEDLPVLDRQASAGVSVCPIESDMRIYRELSIHKKELG